MLKMLAPYRNYLRQERMNRPYIIRFYNFWEQDIPDMWFYRFIESRQLLKGTHKQICFYSTLGSRDIIRRTRKDVNIFFTGENLKHKIHLRYADHLLAEESIGLALGFECFDDPRYLRFPLWMMYMFEPESDDEAIARRCEELNHPQGGTHKRFACHVSSVDASGQRERMCRAISQIETVDCAGKVMHNCDDLWQAYGNDKHRFISEYKFNLCPENSNCQGYVTEKIFQAIAAGCIPVYWGSNNAPEPRVLNPDAILFWNMEGDNSATLEKIRQLNSSQALYDEFASQPRLTANATDIVTARFHALEQRIRALL